jgi:hypothetical protein
MNESEWLLLIVCALSLYGVGQIWLVQLSSYRLWTYVADQDFRAYHAAWWRGIWGPILAPSALLTLGAVLMIWLRAPGVPPWATWLGLALQASLVVGTAAWWGPLMARLEKPNGGLSPERYRLMMSTHWIRVAIVSAYGALALWMTAQSAWLS